MGGSVNSWLLSDVIRKVKKFPYHLSNPIPPNIEHPYSMIVWAQIFLSLLHHGFWRMINVKRGREYALIYQHTIQIWFIYPFTLRPKYCTLQNDLLPSFTHNLSTFAIFVAGLWRA